MSNFTHQHNCQRQIFVLTFLIFLILIVITAISMDVVIIAATGKTFFVIAVIAHAMKLVFRASDAFCCATYHILNHITRVQ